MFIPLPLMEVVFQATSPNVEAPQYMLSLKVFWPPLFSPWVGSESQVMGLQLDARYLSWISALCTSASILASSENIISVFALWLTGPDIILP